MNLDSIFDAALTKCDQAVENVMASKFRLRLRDGTNFDIKAIFDANLKSPTSENKNTIPFIAEYGALTVFNQRINRDLVYGSAVTTPLGERYVASVEYPDATTSLLILSLKSQGQTVSSNDNFL